MLFTPLHLALGERPGPLTDKMIDDAITQGIEESDTIDWKKELPPEKKFRETGLVSDIAAFANAGGGIIVFGVSETGKAADARHDAGELSESYERTIRQVSMAAITPPVFGVQAIAIPSSGAARAVALVIPASPDGPHLVYKNDMFAAPLRTGADTRWMKERELEAAYRSRFEGARRAEQALRQIYDDLSVAADSSKYVVLVGAARPRTRRLVQDPDEMPGRVERASLVTRWWMTGTSQYGPLENVQTYTPRPTTRGQYFPPQHAGDYREAHAVVLNDGSVGLAWRAAGHERDKTGKHYQSHQIPTLAIEAFAASLIALVHAVAGDGLMGDYEVILGVEFKGAESFEPEFHEAKAAPPSGVHRPLAGRFRPVQLTVSPSATDKEFIRTAIELATVALNQVGVKKPVVLDPMLPPRPRNWDR